MSMPKLNAPAEIHWRRSNMNTRDPILMKSVEVLKGCRSLNATAEMNCPMPRSVEKVPIRNEKRCSKSMALCRTQLKICRFALQKGVYPLLRACMNSAIHSYLRRSARRLHSLPLFIPPDRRSFIHSFILHSVVFPLCAHSDC